MVTKLEVKSQEGLGGAGLTKGVPAPPPALGYAPGQGLTDEFLGFLENVTWKEPITERGGERRR